MKRIILVIFALLLVFGLSACEFETTNSTENDIKDTFDVAEELAERQPTPTDVDYSLERLNLIARAYWVNGQRDKALTILNTSPVPLPLGYIVLFAGPTIVAQFTVQGKVSSLNSWLTPDFIDKYYSNGGVLTIEMPDIDGTYGTNDDGIFFFTPDGRYIEWTGEYLYTDYFINVPAPIITYTDGE